MKAMLRNGRTTGRAGLTLLEMVVVMAILAALTTLAIRMTSGVANQGRYEATEKTLTAFRTACIGAPADLNSGLAPQLSSFVADLGRLPQATTPSGGGIQTLHELHGFTANLPPYAFRVATSANTVLVVPPALTNFPIRPSNPSTQTAMVPTVRLPSGWRGPYLYLGSAGQWLDGWGKLIQYNPILTNLVIFRDIQGNLTSPGAQVAQVEVANGPLPGYATAGSDPYAVGSQYSRITPNEVSSDLVVQIRIAGLGFLSGTTNTLQTRVFGPNPNANSTDAAPIRCLGVSQTINVDQSALSVDFSGLFFANALTPGPKVVIC
ncbi:MAG: type II secretion system protein, partial [Verrucomicrobiota bacterium]